MRDAAPSKTHSQPLLSHMRGPSCPLQRTTRQRLGRTKFGGMNTPSRIRPIRPIGSHEHAIASGPSKASCSGAATAAPAPASKTAASAGSLARPLPDAFVPVAAGAPAALASGRSPTDGVAAMGSCASAAPPPGSGVRSCQLPPLLLAQPQQSVGAHLTNTDKPASLPAASVCRRSVSTAMASCLS